MTTKKEVLGSIDESYLTEFYSSYLSMNISPFNVRKKIQSKFSLNKIKLLRSYWEIGFSSIKLGEMFKEDGEVRNIMNAIRKVMSHEFSMFPEIQIGKRICDIFMISKNLEFWAVEIKGRKDKLSSIVSQCSDYKTWADRVCIMTDISFSDKIKSNTFFTDNGIGIYFYKNGEIIEEKESQLNIVDKKSFLGSFSVSYLKGVARDLGLKSNLCRKVLTKQLLKFDDLNEIKRSIAKQIHIKFNQL